MVSPLAGHLNLRKMILTKNLKMRIKMSVPMCLKSKIKRRILKVKLKMRRSKSLMNCARLQNAIIKQRGGLVSPRMSGIALRNVRKITRKNARKNKSQSKNRASKHSKSKKMQEQKKMKT